MPSRNKARELFGNAVAVGFFGGSFAALADLAATCYGHQSGPFLLLATVFLRIILIYGAIGTLGMLFFAGLFGVLSRFAEENSCYQFIIILSSSGMVCLTVSLKMAQILDIYSNPSTHAFAWVVFVSVSASWTTHQVLMAIFRKGIPKRSLRWIGSLILVLWPMTTYHFWDSMNTIHSSPVLKTTSAALQKKPNILWIVLDSVRADHLSCYGYERKTTPALDHLAAEGTLYLNAIAPTPDCMASHASLLTGLLPSRFGMGTTDWQWLDHRFLTIPEVLNAHGYRTIGISEDAKNFSPVSNVSKGFKNFKVVEIVVNFNDLLIPRTLEKVFSISSGKWRSLVWRLRLALLEAMIPPCRDIRAQVTSRYAMHLMSDVLNGSKPFFLFINFGAVHSPYGKTPYADRFLHEIAMSHTEAAWRATRDTQKPNQAINRDRQAYSALYDGDLSYLDEQVGQLIEGLRQKGILDNTILIVTSDHGEDLGEFNLTGHGLHLYHRQLHVPLIIRFPRSFPQGQRIDTKVSLTEIVPTLLEILRIKGSSAGMQEGESLLPARVRQTPILSELFQPEPLMLRSNVLQACAKSVYEGDYHFITAHRGEQLYNVKKDIFELHDLSLVQPDVVVRMRRLLQQRMSPPDPYWAPRFGVEEQ